MAYAILMRPSLNAMKVLAFKVQEYLKAKRQRNKSSDGNIHLVKVNNGYHQKWGFEKSQIDRINQKITH